MNKYKIRDKNRERSERRDETSGRKCVGGKVAGLSDTHRDDSHPPHVVLQVAKAAFTRPLCAVPRALQSNQRLTSNIYNIWKKNICLSLNLRLRRHHPSRTKNLSISPLKVPIGRTIVKWINVCVLFHVSFLLPPPSFN